MTDEPPAPAEVSNALSVIKRALHGSLKDPLVGGDRAVHFAKVRVSNVPELSTKAWQTLLGLCGARSLYVFTQHDRLVTCQRCLKKMRDLKTLHGANWLEFT